MEDIIKNIAKLIDLKSIISLVCTGLFVFGTVTRIITGDQALTIIVMVLTYYFSRKDGGNE